MNEFKVTREQVEGWLDEFDSGIDVEVMSIERDPYMESPKVNEAELRGTLLTENGDEPIWLGWNDVSECDIDELVQEINDYIQAHLDDGWARFSMALETRIDAIIPEMSDEHIPLDNHVDVEVFNNELESCRPVRMEKRYDINSPDGFGLAMDETYESPELAWEAFDRWLKRYEKQGYYSSTTMGRLPLDRVKENCALVIIETR